MFILKHIPRAFLLSIFFVLSSFKGIATEQSQPAKGVFWGSFDPPTLAHKEIILQALETFNLDKIIIVLNDFKSKSYHAPITDRTAMIKLMLYGLEEKVQVIAQNESAIADYQALKKTVSGTLYAIAGQDSYEKWKLNQGLDFAHYDGIVVVPRGRKSKINIPTDLMSKVIVLEIAPRYRYFSSTKIRDKLHSKRCVGLDPAICKYIHQHHLYQ
ncbi:MAG: adenylyltransferase/cytidyltransferase family protein [Alphaproteobacteria bacterium]|nr:adenylyltransferase/cytidyltransferase family protein [Alphaproteobacteria bacterium]